MNSSANYPGLKFQRAAASGEGRTVAANRFARGFTLIEIMVVVVIIGILVGIVAPNIMKRTETAKLVKAKQDIRSIETALDLYRMDNFYYPTTEQGLEALVRPPQSEPPARNWQEGGYLKRLPKDPWGRDYQYLSPGINGEVDIFSLGRDGRPDGEGLDADIGNWNLDS